MKTGFSLVNEKPTISQQELVEVGGMIFAFTKNALQLSGIYVEHAGRNGVTVQDIQMAMKVQVFDFFTSPDLHENISEMTQFVQDEMITEEVPEDIPELESNTLWSSSTEPYRRDDGTYNSSGKWEQAHKQLSTDTMIVHYAGDTITIPPHSNYWIDHSGKILIGWNRSYNPPLSSSSQSIIPSFILHQPIRPLQEILEQYAPKECITEEDMDDIFIPDEELNPFTKSLCICRHCNRMNEVDSILWKSYKPSPGIETIMWKHIEAMYPTDSTESTESTLSLIHI